MMGDKFLLVQELARENSRNHVKTIYNLLPVTGSSIRRIRVSPLPNLIRKILSRI